MDSARFMRETSHIQLRVSSLTPQHPSGGPMGSESQPKCSDPNRFPKMAAFLLQFARSSVPDE